MDDRVTINEFLAERRLAVVGVSHHPKDFTRGLFRELLARGYDLVPVNPRSGEIEGRSTVPRVQNIQPPVGGALLFTSPAVTAEVVRDCREAGVRRVWMHRGAGQGAVSDEAVAFCRAHGIAVIAGACPYMFLPGAGFVHRVHGFIHRHLAA